jgi:hypothetical protein
VNPRSASCQPHNALQEFFSIQRFRQAGLEAGLQCPGLVFRASIGGESHGRDVPTFLRRHGADGLQECVAAPAWHGDVADKEVRPVRFEVIQHGIGGCQGRDVSSYPCQGFLQHIQRVLVIIDDSDGQPLQPPPHLPWDTEAGSGVPGAGLVPAGVWVAKMGSFTRNCEPWPRPGLLAWISPP